MNEVITRKKFSEINLDDPFFDSLKGDYQGFEDWFHRKANEDVLVQLDDDQHVQAFLYLKAEKDQSPEGVSPGLPRCNWLKVGTFKVNSHDTRLGDRFIKKIMDAAIYGDFDKVYVTIFPKYTSLIGRLSEYGFQHLGDKADGEKVLVKDMKAISGDILKDYPMISIKDKRIFLLSIYPKYHTKLFPDSILKTEKNVRDELIRDVSYTNSIHKIYLCFMPKTAELKRGDIIVIYRTNDSLGPAYYRSVVTSVCQVEEIRTRESFINVEDFITYTNYYSIFDKEELRQWFRKMNLVVIKMTYNIALNKRVTRGWLINELGISPYIYWGFFQLKPEQFSAILQKGEVDKNAVID